MICKSTKKEYHIVTILKQKVKQSNANIISYLNHKVELEASMMYIFNQNTEGDYSADINTFLGASYFINPSKKPEKPRWFGVGLSILAWQNGTFFKENTWRLTLGARFGKHFTVLPELYFGDNFNEIMPGLRMQVTF
jgi:hypothetical protein